LDLAGAARIHERDAGAAEIEKVLVSVVLAALAARRSPRKPPSAYSGEIVDERVRACRPAIVMHHAPS